MVYDDILDGILKAEGLGKSEDLPDDRRMISKKAEAQIKYIESLRPFARELWKSFKKQKITIDYSKKEIQNSYLLRYFLPYANLLSKEIQDSGVRFPDQRNLSVSLFGCGPAPCLVSLLFYLKKNSVRRIVKASLFDKASWDHARDIVRNHIIPNIWDSNDLKIDSFTSDFSTDSFWTESVAARKAISESNLVVFQNCLNEITDKEMIINNIGKIIASLSSDSFIVFIDQGEGKYSKSTDYILKDILGKSKASSKKLKIIKNINDNSFNCKDINSNLPDMGKFLYYTNVPSNENKHGLILRNKINYSSVVLKRL